MQSILAAYTVVVHLNNLNSLLMADSKVDTHHNRADDGNS